MTAHTPGPWEAQGYDGGPVNVVALKVNPQRVICQIIVRDSTGHLSQAKANAQLIADAPTLKQQNAELLEALEAMVAAFGEMDGRIPADVGSRTLAEQEAINRRALRQASAAIDKAEKGGSDGS